MEFDRPSIERISTSPPPPITWEESKENESLELKQFMDTNRREIIDISSDEEELPAEAHESRRDNDGSDDGSDDVNDDTDLSDEEASDSFDDAETDMDVVTFEDDYGEEDAHEEAETGEDDEQLESDMYDEGGIIDPAALDAAVRDADEDIRTPELQWDNFTEATRSGYEDAYPTDFSELVQSHGHGQHVGDPSEVTQHTNERGFSIGSGELVQFRAYEGHAWNLTKISEYSNGETHSQKLTDTQQIKKEYAEVPFASYSPVCTMKKKQMQPIDLTESDDDVEAQVQGRREINAVELMEAQNSPMQGIQPVDLSRLPRDRTQVHFKQTVEYEPTSHHKVASPSDTQFTSIPKAEPKVEHKVDYSKDVVVLQPVNKEVKVFTKGNIAQPKYAVGASVLASATELCPHPPGHEIFEIPLVDLLDVQRLRNLINSHVRAIYASIYPTHSTYDVVITRDLKSGDWVAHAMVNIQAKKQPIMLMESRDQKGHLESLQKLQAMAMEKMSGRVKAMGRFGGRVQGFPI